MKAIDMTKIYKRFKGKWVALESPEEKKVIASASTLKEVVAKARKKGVTLPFVLQIPKRILPIVG